MLAAACALAWPRAAFAQDEGNDDAAPSSIPLLIIVVGFDGAEDPASAVPYRTDYDWSAYAFGTEESVASYYTSMSGGQFAFVPAHESSEFGEDGNANEADRQNDGVVHVTLHAPHGAWAAVNEDTAVTRDFCKSALSALDLAKDYVDFASYDANDNGVLTVDELAIVFCIAGYEASAAGETQEPSLPLIWAHSGTLGILGVNVTRIDGMSFGPYVTFAEQYWVEGTALEAARQQPVGLLCHELGHALGLPDLYAIDDGSGAATWGAYSVGALSLMATGGWTDSLPDPEASPSLPGALDAWSRYELGWSAPTVVRESGDYTVTSDLSESGYSQLLIPTANPNRYYLVENRQPEGYDEHLGQAYEHGAARGGIVIWLVDEKLCDDLNLSNTVNSTSHHPGVMPLFCEVTPSWTAHSQDWATSQPALDQPFYDSVTWAERYGEEAVALELPTYASNESNDVPGDRVASGASISFTSESAREMTVHIELSDDLRAAIIEQLLRDAFVALLPNSLP